MPCKKAESSLASVPEMAIFNQFTVPKDDNFSPFVLKLLLKNIKKVKAIYRIVLMIFIKV